MTDPADGLDLDELDRLQQLCEAAPSLDLTHRYWGSGHWAVTIVDGACIATIPPLNDDDANSVAALFAEGIRALPQALATIRARDAEIARLNECIRVHEASLDHESEVARLGQDTIDELESESSELQARVAELEAALDRVLTAAKALVERVHERHDREASPLRYTVPWRHAVDLDRAVVAAELRRHNAALAGQPVDAEGK